MTLDLDSLKKLRRTLHQYPEISGEEEGTSQRIKEYLKDQGPDKIIDLQKYGLAAIYDSTKEGMTVLLRGDMDALPIDEVNNFAHKSKVDGVSHKCGHDGHSTIVCGVAQWLNKNRPQKGKVVLLFQPAEETGQGAMWMLDDPQFKEIEPDHTFALHNLPGFPMHSIIWRTGTFTASVISMVVKLRGKTSHAGQPDKGINPARAIAELLMESEKLTNHDPDQDDFQLVTPIFAELGRKNYGTSAGRGEVHFTLRAWTTKRMKQLADAMKSKAKELAKKEKLDCKISWIQEFISNENGAESVELILNAAKKHDLKTIEMDRPFRWGEDYGRFSSKFKGAMFGLGSGENTPDLHNPDYDFPDEIIETGVKTFVSILQQLNCEE